MRPRRWTNVQHGCQADAQCDTITDMNMSTDVGDELRNNIKNAFGAYKLSTPVLYSIVSCKSSGFLFLQTLGGGLDLG